MSSATRSSACARSNAERAAQSRHAAFAAAIARSASERVPVDLLVAGDVDLARVADRLRILVRDPRQHRDLVLGEAELLHRRDADLVRQAVERLDARLRGLERLHAAGVDAEGDSDARV